MAPLFGFLSKKGRRNENKPLVDVSSRAAFNTASFRDTGLPLKSPYSVVTEPKKHRGPSSCPGGNYRPSKHGQTYENLSNHGKSNRTHQLTRNRRRVDEFDAALRPQSNAHQYCDSRQQSSEYESNGSPIEIFRSRGRHHNFESSEYDSDSDASLAADYYRTKYLKEIRNVKRKYKNIARESCAEAQTLKRDYEAVKFDYNRLYALFNQMAVENQELKTRISQLEASRQSSITPSDPCSLTGAREALCSMSEINVPPVVSSQLQSHYDRYNGNISESDELKDFPKTYSDFSVELPRRDDSISVINGYLNVPNIQPLRLGIEDDGYSTLNNMFEQQQNNNLDLVIPVQLSHIKNQTVRFEATEETEDSSDEFDGLESQCRTPVNELQKTNKFTIEIPSVPQLKRSWSDSALNNLSIENDQMTVPSNNKSQRPSYRRSRKYDYSSSYSSDDNTVELMERQLRRRGDLVQYRPPRANIARSTKVFYRYGPTERRTMDQFNFLNCLSTDGSALEESADASTHYSD
ncbi:hypothetical protein M3Y98_00798400 [Aphelenchoides besseyi]|nr:hypothetical protein M3Y98_00798400 [Aphelenchoides besseyi]KAI6212012.1 hypothetical protein M3Y96_00495200 [Aphelenchoides besseyi]